MTSSQLVLHAVAADRVTTMSGLLQRLFARWFDAFVYNQIWEDPRVDIEALAIDKDSRILTISSGGCNVLNYLVEGPSTITAVDLNSNHIYLLRLKLAALRVLPEYEAFYRLFALGTHPENLAAYSA